VKWNVLLYRSSFCPGKLWPPRCTQKSVKWGSRSAKHWSFFRFCWPFSSIVFCILRAVLSWMSGTPYSLPAQSSSGLILSELPDVWRSQPVCFLARSRIYCILRLPGVRTGWALVPKMMIGRFVISVQTYEHKFSNRRPPVRTYVCILNNKVSNTIYSVFFSFTLKIEKKQNNMCVGLWKT